MNINTKGAVRLIMPNGSFDIQDVKRVIVGKIHDPTNDFPKNYFRSIRIETEEGSIEILMESRSPKSLQMEPEGGLIATLKKQVIG